VCVCVCVCVCERERERERERQTDRQIDRDRDGESKHEHSPDAAASHPGRRLHVGPQIPSPQLFVLEQPLASARTRSLSMRVRMQLAS
jgi:hypothetical protein